MNPPLSLTSPSTSTTSFSSHPSATAAATAAAATAASAAAASVRPSARLAALGLWVPPVEASETGLGLGGVEVRVGAVVTDLMNATRCALTQSQGKIDALIAALDYPYTYPSAGGGGGGVVGEGGGSMESSSDYRPQGVTGGRGEAVTVSVPVPDATIPAIHSTSSPSPKPSHKPTPISPDQMKAVVPALTSLVRACVGLDALDTPLCHLRGLGKAHCLRVEEMLMMVQPQLSSYHHNHIVTSTANTSSNTTTNNSNAQKSSSSSSSFSDNHPPRSTNITSDPTLQDPSTHVAIVEAARVLMMLPAALGSTPIIKPHQPHPIRNTKITPIDPPYQPHPTNPPYRHTLSTHTLSSHLSSNPINPPHQPINPPYQLTLPTHPTNPPHQPTYQPTPSTHLSTHPINPPTNPPNQPTLSTHPINVFTPLH